MSSPFLRHAVILGLVSAIGPFAIDMYLPALPSIGQSLNASAGAVQMSLTAFFVAIGVCQLAYGPATDMFGRKAPIYFGLALFCAGSVGCALAPNVEALIAFRVLQAIGACAGMVVPRAVVRDLHTGADAARLMSLLMLVFSVSPILAPLTGSFVISAFGWRGVFWGVLIAALVAWALVAFGLRETRPEEARHDASWRGSMRVYGRLLRDRGFMGLVMVGTLGISAFFVYLSTSSFVIIDHYGYGPMAYSLFFSVNAVAFFGAAQLNGFLASRFGLTRVVRVAVTGFAAALILLLALVALGLQNLFVIAGLLFVAYGFLGLVLPTTSVLALEAHGHVAGTASALMGATQMVVGSIIMAIVGLFANGTPLPMVAGIAACGVGSFLVAQLTLPKGKDAQPNAAA
jgi:DHA1 family bicyclomycin/chloramphenicol resistance-like MFS transporter